MIPAKLQLSGDPFFTDSHRTALRINVKFAPVGQISGTAANSSMAAAQWVLHKTRTARMGAQAGQIPLATFVRPAQVATLPAMAQASSRVWFMFSPR
jgi:hypothetical protein